MVTVCVVGGLNMDLVVKSPRLPSEGETLTGGVFSTFPGGKGANQAVAAARLGAAVAMVGRVGTDAFGQRLVQSLETEGVNTRCVRLDAGSATGVACVTVDADGRNTIVVAPGANGNVSDEDIYSAGAVVAGAQVVLLQLEIPLAAVLQTSRIAHARGAVVVLDPAPAAPLPDELYSLVDVLNPNQSEAAALTGMSVRSPADAERAARALFARGPRTIVIKLGGQGAWYLSAERQGHIPAAPVTAVDTTAAGDAFAAALGVALGEGCGIEEAVAFAVQAAGLAVTRMGAQPSMPRRGEVDRLIRGAAGQGAKRPS